MRIIAGAFRRHPLVAPKGTTTRPTTDRVREALFQHLEVARFSFEGARVLDLFAGAGTLGLEALSRGARSLVAVERDRRALEALRTNVQRLGVEDRVKIVSAPLPRALRHVDGPFDVVFSDPPYESALRWIQELAEPLRQRSDDSAWWIAEHAGDESVRAFDAAHQVGSQQREASMASATSAQALPWRCVDVRAYGDTAVTLLQAAGGADSERDGALE